MRLLLNNRTGPSYSESVFYLEGGWREQLVVQIHIAQQRLLQIFVANEPQVQSHRLLDFGPLGLQAVRRV